LTLSQTLWCSSPGRPRGRNRGLGLHSAATLPSYAAVSYVDLLPFVNALESKSIESVIVVGKKAAVARTVEERDRSVTNRRGQESAWL
jgi:hypothetical protein